MSLLDLAELHRVINVIRSCLALSCIIGAYIFFLISLKCSIIHQMCFYFIVPWTANDLLSSPYYNEKYFSFLTEICFGSNLCHDIHFCDHVAICSICIIFTLGCMFHFCLGSTTTQGSSKNSFNSIH